MEYTERQTLTRLCDAAREGASCADEMCRLMMMHMPATPNLLIRLLRSVREASGCAHQLAHMQQNPQFLTLRDQLDEAARLMTGVSFGQGPVAGMMIAKMGEALDQLQKTAEKMGTAKPVTRADVLSMLDERKMGRA